MASIFFEKRVVFGAFLKSAFWPKKAPSACERPTVVVDLPSPNGVGLMPQTTT